MLAEIEPTGRYENITLCTSELAAITIHTSCSIFTDSIVQKIPIPSPTEKGNDIQKICYPYYLWTN